jgi:diguanylate cyclase (GGDEF)-like protein
LTGAANRRAWDDELAASLARLRAGVPLRRDDRHDQFRKYNDRFGHQGGAGSSRRPPQRSQHAAGDDVLARIGGDEFAVLLPGCPLDMAATIAERLRGAVPATARCSVGVAVWNGREAGPQFLARADRALYDAKGSAATVVVMAVTTP